MAADTPSIPRGEAPCSGLSPGRLAQLASLLEVTARNEGAIRLYRRLGFRCRKTVYKAVGPPLTFDGACL